ncbi:hypothetical protein LFM09_27550 [Lentzea alba]|uniref:hypothetical protein n=1 Tax=Lentzea alba TaxID=2714351 RepID=UPI0039BEF36E
MTNFLQLHSHFVQQMPGGISVNNLRSTLTLGDGSTVQFALPCLPIGGGLVLVPAVYTEGPSGVRMDFGRWSPGYCANGFGVILPFSTTDQALAVRVCQSFHAAPDTAWTDSVDTVMAWLRASGFGASS